MVWRLDAAALHRLEVAERGLQERARDHTSAEGDRCVDTAEAGQRGVDQSTRRVGDRQVAGVGHHFHGRAERLEFLHQTGGRISHHQVVPTLGQQAGDGRPDVEAGVGDEGDTARRGAHRAI